MNSGCSESSGSAGHSAPAASISSWNQWSLPSAISHSASVWRTTITVSSRVRSPITSSTCCLIGAVLPLRRAPSTVISALASENSIRSRTDSALKPPKTTLWTAPIRAHASIATATSGIIGRKIPTTSPARMPRSFSAFAKRCTSAWSDAYVMSRSSPSSPRQWKATRSPRPASTWRSRQLYETLSRPPTNHLANGGFDQSSTWSHLRNQCSCSACCAQNPSGSASAASYTDGSETTAPSRKSSGGGKVSCSSSWPSSWSSVAPSAMGSPPRSGPLPPTLVKGERLLGAQPRLRPHVQLRERALRHLLAAQQRADDAAEEAERDRDDARVGERPADRRAGVGVRARPDARRDDDQEDRRQHAEQHAGHRAGGVEAAPREREQERREVGARRDREREPDHERDVQAGAADDRHDDRDRADRRRRDLRHPDLLALGVLVLADDARPDVVRDRRRRAEHQARDDREDRRERHASDHGQEQVP